MKHSIITCITLVFALTSCQDASSKIKNQVTEDLNVQAATPTSLPAFSFAMESHDFGQINEGEVVSVDFPFTNDGEAPLIISNASGSCGCTVPQWPRTPIAPGESGVISVSFNSESKPGNQNKTVTLTSNTMPNVKVLKISAQVTPKIKQ